MLTNSIKALDAKEEQVTPYRFKMNQRSSYINDYDLSAVTKEDYDAIIGNAVANVPFKPLVAQQNVFGGLKVTSMAMAVLVNVLERAVDKETIVVDDVVLGDADLARIESCTFTLFVVKPLQESFDKSLICKY